MSVDEKESLVEFFQTRTDLSENFSDYQESIDDLVFRLDYSEKIVEPVFNFILKIVEESYDFLSSSHQNKLITNLKIASKSLKYFLNKLNPPDLKTQYLKELVKRILKTVSISSILAFNAVFEEG